MNQVVISGRLVKDPEIRYNSGENANAFLRFNVACQRSFKNSEGNYDADFPSVIAWGRTAEFVNNNFHKGDVIEIVGELRTGSYVNKEGQKVYTTDVNADRVAFPVGGNKNSGKEADPMRNKTAPTDRDFVNDIPDDEEDLPFN